MTIFTIDQNFFSELLRDEGIEYAVFDAEKRLVLHSDGLAGYLLSPPEGALPGQKIHRLFPEFVGYEKSLQDVLTCTLPEVTIERVHRADLKGKDGYVTLQARPFENGLLLIARDATKEGQLEQKVTQQRNELSLLSSQLVQARTHLDDLLHRFVSSAVVDEMLSDHRKTELRGQRREITVLFADLCGFTSWAETHEPEKVLDVINSVYGEAVKILLEAGATLDKFIGDALMAIFNAPIEQPDHADRALDCARRISLLKPGVSELRFGIGINTGPAIVGNIGTQQEMNYRVLGDAVNIAKYLEEITEPGQVLIGPRTHELANPGLSRISVGQVRLRGKQSTISTYELLF